MVAGFLAFIGTGIYLIGGMKVCDSLTDDKGKTSSLFYNLKLVEFAIFVAVLNPAIGLWKSILIGSLHMISGIISTRSYENENEFPAFLKTLEFAVIFPLFFAVFTVILN